MWVRSQDGGVAINFNPAIRLFITEDEIDVKEPDTAPAICIGKYSSDERILNAMDLIMKAHAANIAVLNMPEDSDDAVENACSGLCDYERWLAKELDKEQCSANTPSGHGEENHA